MPQPFLTVAEKVGRMHDMPRSAKILDIQEENEFVRTFTLDLSVRGKPGQFVLLWIPRVDEKPFSIGMDDGQTLQLTVAKVGAFTEKLFEMKVGDRVGVRGAYGTSFQVNPGERLGLVGGGYGSVPLYFLATRAVQAGCSVEFFLGARSESHLLYVDRIESLPSTQLHLATDDGSRGYKGFNLGLLKEKVDAGLTLSRLLTVGPERMMKAVSDFALEQDIPCQVSVERYMKCGFGICGQCVLDNSGMPTCLQGPVMDHLIARDHPEFGAYHRDRLGKKKPW